MRLTPDYLVGRRFRFLIGRNVPEFTCTGYDPDQRRVRVHAMDGGKWWFPFAYLRTALRGGAIEESEGVPFVFERNFMPTKEQQQALKATRIQNNHEVRAIVRRLRVALQEDQRHHVHHQEKDIRGHSLRAGSASRDRRR